MEASASWRGAVALAEADALPGAYYVTCRREDGRTAFLLGPFVQRTPGQNAHAQALGLVHKARRYVQEKGADHFHSLTYGTARVARFTNLPTGKLNDALLAANHV